MTSEHLTYFQSLLMPKLWGFQEHKLTLNRVYRIYICWIKLANSSFRTSGPSVYWTGPSDLWAFGLVDVRTSGWSPWRLFGLHNKWRHCKPPDSKGIGLKFQLLLWQWVRFYMSEKFLYAKLNSLQPVSIMQHTGLHTAFATCEHNVYHVTSGLVLQFYLMCWILCFNLL
jgi:hypothetical protein